LFVLCSFTLLIHGANFDRVFIIQFENQYYGNVVNDPGFKWISEQGKLLTNSYGVTHPSQPNYWAQIAGDHFRIYSDGVYEAVNDNTNFKQPS